MSVFSVMGALLVCSGVWATSMFHDDETRRHLVQTPVSKGGTRPLVRTDKRQCTNPHDENMKMCQLVLVTPPKVAVRQKPFSPVTGAGLKELGLSPGKLYRSIEQVLLTPDRRDIQFKPLRAVRSQRVRHAVVSHEIVPFDNVLAAMDSRITRSGVPAALMISGVSVSVVDLHPSVSHADEAHETDEEALARRARQKALLEEVRMRRAELLAVGAFHQKSARKREAEKIQVYVDYLSQRRAQCAQHGRIRKAELEEVFEAVFSPSFQCLESSGYKVWYKASLLNLDIEVDGMTNRERMNMGQSPLGSDGNPMHLHHVTQYDALTHKTRSDLVFLHHKNHQTLFSTDLHMAQSEYYLPHQPVDRSLFGGVRPDLIKAVEKALSA